MEENKNNPAADMNAAINAMAERRKSLQQIHEQHKQQCAVQRMRLEEAEALRDDAASRVDEITAQLTFLRGLTAAAAETAQ